MVTDRLTIEGTTVEATTPEGAVASIPVPEFIDAMRPALPDTGELVLFNGIRAIRSEPTLTVAVLETAPRVHAVRWIAADSPARHRQPGAQVKYDQRSLAMPYLVLFAVFVRDAAGRLVLSNRNEAYFRVGPVRSLDDELCFPALLNVSRYPRGSAPRLPLAWVCTQYTPLGTLAAEPDLNRRVRQSLAALHHTLMETGFNYSSEQHDLTSYWTLSARAIPEIRDLDRWEQLSRDDPMFVLNVRWLPARIRRRRMTVGTMIDRIVSLHGKSPAPADSAALVRVVHHRSARLARSAAP